MTLIVTFVGLLIGFIDIHSPQGIWQNGFYMLASAALACRMPKLFWLWPLVFAFTLYAVHIWALRHGYRQPYVEHDEDDAIYCLFAFFPSMFSALAGVGICALYNWGNSLKS